jgi:hypothetical protein
MILLNGIGIGLLLFAHYIMWINAKTWQQFIMYAIGFNLFGLLVGGGSGLMLGRKILKRRKEQTRQDRLKELSGK